MRKFTLIIVLLLSVNMMFAQTATLKIGTIDNAQPGTILVPITLEAINNPIIGSNLICCWQWSITYNASVLNAGAPGSPATLVNYSAQFPSGNYLTQIIADNPAPGWNTIIIIYSSAISGIGSVGMKFFDIHFTYLNGATNLNWSIGSGYFDMWDDWGNDFTLTLIDGSVSSSSGPSATLNAKMFLEGPYFNSQMTPFLNILGYIPLDQPYNTEPWNYNGTETVTAIPNANVVDWVLVELLERHQGNEEYLFEVKAGKAAFLLKNGDIKDLDGTSSLVFNNFDEPEFYLRIYHRNHLPLISTVPLTGTNGIYNYDFTTGPAKAIGGASVQKQLKVDLWGAMTGDGDASRQIDNKDKNDLWLIENNLTGYHRGDYNMDSQVDNDDKAIKWKSNAGRGLPAVRDSIPPPAPWACGDPIVDLRDSQSYNTVEIGTQCWMAENLNIGTLINGSGNQTDNAILEKYCYDNNETNCDTYGGLYQWNEMMQYTTQQGIQGICPDGWHIPTDIEWTTLTDFLGGQSVAGGKMKEAGYAHWNSPNTGATNESGFTALPGGGYFDGNFGNIFILEGFWSSTEYNSDNTWYRRLLYNSASIDPINYSKSDGFSVRCIQGEYVNQPPEIPTAPQPPDGAINQPTNSTLSWTCNEPDNDPLTFDVYFDTIDPPALVSAGQTDNTYNPGQLAESTSYFWKIVAHDNQGFTTEGPVWSFTTRAWQCADPLIDTRDMQTYPTVQIGTQCWMAENLNIGNMVQGNVNMTNNSIIEKYCYSNSAANCDVYGGLYQWNEMMQYVTLQGTQGICPTGWHLPKDSEWTTLTDYLGGASVAGGKLKETGNNHWLSPNNGATNESGFTALPGGYRYSGGIFLDMGASGYWWSSTESTPDALYRSMTNMDAVVYSDVYYKSSGFSVRCVLGEYVNQPPTIPSNPQPINGAIDQPVNTTLSWTCTDIENDPLTFDVYFGATNPPSLVSSGQTAADYNPGLLDNSTTYLWKIVAHDNQTNTTEGPVFTFTTIAWLCNQPFVDTRDGQTYSSVQIGEQCWMAENLNIGNRIDGIGDQTDNSILEKYCYDNSEANCDVYGGLYQWNEMMQYVTTEGVQGICPTGWHVPTDGEWTGLTDFLGGATVAGGKMKSTGTIEEETGLWYEPNTGATNESGFSSIPGGNYYNINWFDGRGYYSVFWSSSAPDFNPNEPWYWFLENELNDILSNINLKSQGLSVRCIKDTPPTWSCGDILNDTRDNQTYNTVQIGDQCWMAENLNIGTMIPGTTEMTNNSIIEKYCYDNNTTNCDTYGGLYQWNEMMQYVTTEGVQGICPTGWHVPTNGEWCTLTTFIDPTVDCNVITYGFTGIDVGTKMKNTSGWNGGNGTNSSGFTALASGFLWKPNFYNLSSGTMYLTSTLLSSFTFYIWYLESSSSGIIMYDDGSFSSIGYSVRCLKD
jgi:uncharacterized protein (TIGR02145 family)